MAIKKLKHITVICRELYEAKGASAVHDYVNQYLDKNPGADIKRNFCKACDAETPHYLSECLICGTEATITPAQYEFAKRMSCELFVMRIEDSDIYDDVPKDFALGIVDDSAHIPLIKKRIETSLLAVMEADKRMYYDSEQGMYRYYSGMYDHCYAVDAYVHEEWDKQVAELFPVFKTVIVCDDCGGINVQSKSWVRPNLNNQFVDLMTEDIQDNFCDDCDCNVTTSSIQVRVDDPKYQVEEEARTPVTDDPKVNLVVDKVIEDLKTDFAQGDYTVLEELLQMIPRKNLVNSRRDDRDVNSILTQCPICKGSNTIPDLDNPTTMRNCNTCGSEWNIEDEITLNGREQ
jgi:hypothetical protein